MQPVLPFPVFCHVCLPTDTHRKQPPRCTGFEGLQASPLSWRKASWHQILCSCPSWRWTLTWLAVRRQDFPADSTQSIDAATGFTFSSFTNDHGVVYNIAVPDPTPEEGTYDLVFQTIVPKTIGWSGIAWGGTMTYNPLTIVWLDGDNVTVSSRMA